MSDTWDCDPLQSLGRSWFLAKKSATGSKDTTLTLDISSSEYTPARHDT